MRKVRRAPENKQSNVNTSGNAQGDRNVSGNAQSNVNAQGNKRSSVNTSGNTLSRIDASENLRKNRRRDSKGKWKLSNRKWNPLILLLSILCAYLAANCFLKIFGYTIGTAGVAGNIFWHALFFAVLFVGGFAGINLGMLASVKYQIRRRSVWLRSFAIAAVLIMAVSAVGELLFSITIETTSGIVETQEGADIVLLLDGSGNLGKSDSEYGLARTQAVTDFLESLDEDDCLQAIVFAAITLPEQTKLLTMNEAGKAEVISCVSSINSVGKTNFDDALEAALDTLESDGRSGSDQLIILLTDGDGTLSDSVKEKLLNSGVTLCTVRTTNSPKSTEGKAVAALAEESGGTDTVLSLGTDGSAEASKMTRAFQEAVNTAAETESEQTFRITLADARLAGSGHTSLYQFVIRTVVLFALIILFGFGYFGKMTPGGALKELPGAVVLSLLVTIFGQSIVTSLLLVLFLGSAFVTLEFDEGKDPKQETPPAGNGAGGSRWSGSSNGFDGEDADDTAFGQPKSDEGDVINV